MLIISKKIVAVGFIALIIIGNIWLVNSFTGHASPAWTSDAFFIVGSIVLIVGAIYLALKFASKSQVPEMGSELLPHNKDGMKSQDKIAD